MKRRLMLRLTETNAVVGDKEAYMGGRGGHIAVQAKPKSRFSHIKKADDGGKTTKQSKQSKGRNPVDFVQHQLGIDLNKYRDDTTKRFDGRGFVTIDAKSVPKSDWRKIEMLAADHGGSMEIARSGTWMAQLRMKKK